MPPSKLPHFQSRHSTLLTVPLPHQRFAHFDPTGPDCGILVAAAYPGDRTGKSVKAGGVVAFTETTIVLHTHSDGCIYAINFLRLADGRGWVHNFNPDKPWKPTCTSLVSPAFPRNHSVSTS